MVDPLAHPGDRRDVRLGRHRVVQALADPFFETLKFLGLNLAAVRVVFAGDGAELRVGNERAHAGGDDAPALDAGAHHHQSSEPASFFDASLPSAARLVHRSGVFRRWSVSGLCAALSADEAPELTAVAAVVDRPAARPPRSARG